MPIGGPTNLPSNMSLSDLLLNGTNHGEGMKRAVGRAMVHRARMTEILNSPDVILGKRSPPSTEVPMDTLWRDHMCSYATVTLDQGTIWMGRNGEAKGFSTMDDGGGLVVGFPVLSGSHGDCDAIMSSLNNPKHLMIVASHAVEEVCAPLRLLAAPSPHIHPLPSKNRSRRRPRTLSTPP